MKNFLLKIVLAGLTLGLVPQGAFAMQNPQDTPRIIAEQTNTVIARNASPYKHLKTAFAFCALLLIQGYSSYTHTPSSLNTKYPQILLHENGTTYTCHNKDECDRFIERAIEEQKSSPYRGAEPTQAYADKFEIGKNIFSSIEINNFFRNSKKYGNIIIPFQEFQDLSHNNKNFTLLQQLSAPQDGPVTCAKYAFANLYAIDQLYKNGNPINDENIRAQIELPLKTIGLLGQEEWKPLEKMINFINVNVPIRISKQINSILNYAQFFFTDNNFHIAITGDLAGDLTELSKEPAIKDMRDYDKIINKVVHDLKTYGISHIFLGCGAHATAFSIMQNGENNYLIIYMDSANLSLGSAKWVSCFKPLKNLITDLKSTIERKLITYK